MQVSDDVGGLEDAPGSAACQQPGVIVDDAGDLGVTAVGQRPVGDVGLPQLVGQVRGKAVPGRAGPFVRLRGDDAADLGKSPVSIIGIPRLIAWAGWG
jgi:hypothetical protein